jgi:hypothetical protein
MDAPFEGPLKPLLLAEILPFFLFSEGCVSCLPGRSSRLLKAPQLNPESQKRSVHRIKGPAKVALAADDRLSLKDRLENRGVGSFSDQSGRKIKQDEKRKEGRERGGSRQTTEGRETQELVRKEEGVRLEEAEGASLGRRLKSPQFSPFVDMGTNPGRMRGEDFEVEAPAEPDHGGLGGTRVREGVDLSEQQEAVEDVEDPGEPLSTQVSQSPFEFLSVHCHRDSTSLFWHHDNGLGCAAGILLVYCSAAVIRSCGSSGSLSRLQKSIT